MTVLAASDPGQVDWTTIFPVGAGWTVFDGKTYSSPPANQQVVVEFHDFTDVNVFGLDGTSVGAQMDDIRAQFVGGGSDLYSYVILAKVDFDFLGVKVTTYRFCLLHSLIWIAWFAIIIAVFFLVSVLSGRSPIATLQAIPDWVCSFFGDACHPSKAQRNTYLILLGAGIAASFAVWGLSNSISKKEFGEGIAPPGAPPITTPGFSSEASSGFNAGPLRTQSSSGVQQHSSSGAASAPLRREAAPARAARAAPAAVRARPAPAAPRRGFGRG